MNIHLHSLVLDGVYLNRNGAAVFHEAAVLSTDGGRRQCQAFVLTYFGESCLRSAKVCEAVALFRLTADEVKHSAIEDLRLLPVRRVPGLGDQHHPAVWNLGPNHSRDRRRRHQIRRAGDQ